MGSGVPLGGRNRDRPIVEFRTAERREGNDYISLQRGMSEGELVTIAGSPDLMFWDARSLKIRGRISEIERVRKF